MPANLKKLTRSSAIVLATATALACSALTTGALAADDLYDPGVTEVEFGTGWYIRGDIGLTGHEILRTTEQANAANGSLTPIVETSEINNVFSAGIGIGAKFGSNLRGDIGYSYMADSETAIRQTATVYRPPCSDAFRLVTTVDQFGNTVVNEIGGQTITNCVEESQTSYFLQSFMANGYYDFDTSFVGLRPFVGLGAGVIRNQYVSTSNDVTCAGSGTERCNPTDGTVSQYGETYTQEYGRNNGTSYHVAGSLSAGLSYAITDTLFLDTTYQYTHMFEDPIWGGSDGIEAANVPTDFHTIKVGLRLDIW